MRPLNIAFIATLAAYWAFIPAGIIGFDWLGTISPVIRLIVSSSIVVATIVGALAARRYTALHRPPEEIDTRRHLNLFFTMPFFLFVAGPFVILTDDILHLSKLIRDGVFFVLTIWAAHLWQMLLDGDIGDFTFSRYEEFEVSLGPKSGAR